MSTTPDPNQTLIQVILEQFRGVRGDLSDHRKESKADMAALRIEFAGQLDKMRGEFNDKIDAVKSDVQPVKTGYTKMQGAWLFGGFLTAAALYVTSMIKNLAGLGQ